MTRFIFGLAAGCLIGAAVPAFATNTLTEHLTGWSVWEGRVLLCKDPVARQGLNEIRCPSSDSASG